MSPDGRKEFKCPFESGGGGDQILLQKSKPWSIVGAMFTRVPPSYQDKTTFIYFGFME